jgi:predicted nuclease of predicted toxin-antitoxin system
VLRFHLDEHVDHAIARALRESGIDVTTTGDAGLFGAEDEQHRRYALQERRVIVTHDADFLRLASQSPHPGIAYCASGTRSLGDLIRYLRLMSDCLEPDDMAGKVEFL